MCSCIDNNIQDDYTMNKEVKSQMRIALPHKPFAPPMAMWGAKWYSNQPSNVYKVFLSNEGIACKQYRLLSISK